MYVLHCTVGMCFYLVIVTRQSSARTPNLHVLHAISDSVPSNGLVYENHNIIK